MAKFEQVNPPSTLRHLRGQRPDWVDDFDRRVQAATVDELVSLNKHWFREPTGLMATLGVLWLINTRFTALGIAPAWRGIPALVDVKPVPQAPARISGPLPIGDTARRNYVRRWVDLEWLRAELGGRHIVRHEKWKDAFVTNLTKAENTWARINFVQSTGGGKAGSEQPHKVLFSLKVPELVRMGLMGLIDRDAGELLMNARRRVARNVRPKLELLMARRRHPLSRQEVDRRLQASEALELAPGSPTDAAKLFGWITGETISRQSMQVMRIKIAEQCRLTTRAWRVPE